VQALSAGQIRCFLGILAAVDLLVHLTVLLPSIGRSCASAINRTLTSTLPHFLTSSLPHFLAVSAGPMALWQPRGDAAHQNKKTYNIDA
jgi:hypothetical protein